MGVTLGRITAGSIVATVTSFLVASLLLLPLFVVLPADSPSIGPVDHTVPGYKIESIPFVGAVNTSHTIPQYPLVSRALMLSNGSSNATIADINQDGRPDLIVADFAGSQLSIFYRDSNGSFPSYPSYNLTVSCHPVAVRVIDAYAAGILSIVVLGRADSVHDYDMRIAIYNFTSETSYTEWYLNTPYPGAKGFVIGNFSPDVYPDIAITCAGTNPDTTNGRIQIFFGPSYSTDERLLGGLGMNAIATGDFDGDGTPELAVTNFFDSNVTIFKQPFVFGGTAEYALSVLGHPVSLAAGLLDGDGFSDLSVVAQDPASLDFHFQSAGKLQVDPDSTYSTTLDFLPSSVIVGDMNDDTRDDVLVLSSESNLVSGYFQQSSWPIWTSVPDIKFPVGSMPRGAVIGDLDSDPSPDIAIASARSDWSGSSIGIYPSKPGATPLLSNSNLSAWGSPTAEATALGSGDINGDGTDDLVLLYPSLNSFGFELSFGSSLHLVPLGHRPSGLLVADLDYDGYCDVLTSMDTTDSGDLLYVHFGGPNPIVSFPYSVITCSDVVTSLQTGDFNNDTLTDLVAVTYAPLSGNVVLDIFYNSGDPFPWDVRTEIPLTWGTPVSSIVVGDFNSDGLDDIALSRPTPGPEIDIMLQNESAPFGAPFKADRILFNSVGSPYSKLWSGDLTGDGKTDIAAMESGSSREIWIFDQDKFSNPRTPNSPPFLLPETPLFVSVFDATDDGFADVVATFQSADLVFLYMQDLGALPDLPSMTFVAGAFPDYVLMGDGNGDYRADLLVSDSRSHSVSVWEQNNFPPLAEAGGPYSVSEGSALILTGSAVTGYSERPYMQYMWFFGDGNSSGWSTTPSVAYSYQHQGVYYATFVAMDPSGLVDNDSATVTVTDSIPVADFTWTPVNPSEGQTVTFLDNTSSFDPLEIINWTVDGSLVSSGTAQSIQETFQNGSHRVDLQVTDNDGSADQVTKYLSVGRLAPTIWISAPSTAPEGNTVDFVANVDPWHSGSGDHIVIYEWNFSYTGGAFHADTNTGPVNHTSRSYQTVTDFTVFTIAVRATDNDGDSSISFFNVTIYDVIKIVLSTVPSGPWREFDSVEFSASVDSASAPTLYEWDFDAQLVGFTADTTTLNGSVSHYYGRAGNFLVKVRVTVENGTWAINSTYISVSDVNLSGDFTFDWYRGDPVDTSNITFDARNISDSFPDLTRSIWEFDDGTSMDLPNVPEQTVTHKFVPSRDFTVSLTVTDGEDGNWRTFSRVLKLRAPSIQLVSPSGDDVVRSGTPVRFAISDDSQSLTSVKYSLDGGPLQMFTDQWAINTTSWDDGTHWVSVFAEDQDGNIARMSGVKIVIDDVKPVITLEWTKTSVFGGDKVNITATIDDQNIDNRSVVLHVEFPGDSSYSQFLMSTVDGVNFYVLIDVPQRAGDMEFYIEASDQAENTQTTSETTITVKLHFIDFAMPYLVALAVLSAILTAVYFMREAKIAVDETFVIYNDGRLIAHSTRRLKPGMDDQILGSMFVAIQDFVKDSFKDVTSFTLRKLEFGEKSVLIEKGDHLFLAVILHGKASRKVASRMEMVVDEIEETFSQYLKEWDGDLDAVRGVNDVVKKLYSRAPMLPSSFRRMNR